MLESNLKIYCADTYLPPTKKVRDIVEQAGGSSEGYSSWETVSVSDPNEHPSDMGAKVLRQALEKINLKPQDLSVIFSVGMSRDYVPSFSVAGEIMKVLGVPGTCMGLDLTLGCLGTLVGLDFAKSWLQLHSGKYAAIICAEKQTWTIDYSHNESIHLRGYGDGAGVLIVGLDKDLPSIGKYVGSSFFTMANLNGSIIDKYGGTRFPIPPPGIKRRREIRVSKQELMKGYGEGYPKAVHAVIAQTGLKPDWLICNQVSPNMCLYLSPIAKVPKDRILITGNSHGHLGGTDIILGLQKLKENSQLSGNILLVSSMPYGWGAGFIQA